MIRCCFVFCIWIGAALLSPIFAQIQPIKTIVLDAGHGGKDPGACVHKRKESQITLKIVQELETLIRTQMPNVKVVLTRDQDKFVELKDRGAIAQQNNADFFISIHCNSVKDTKNSPKGAAFYILGTNNGQKKYESVIRENQAKYLESDSNFYSEFDSDTPEAVIYQEMVRDTYRAESKRLAEQINTQFQRMGRATQGVKQAPFIVLWSSNRPSILVETGYISHSEEVNFLDSTEGQKQIAQAIFNAIQIYNLEASGGIKPSKLSAENNNK